MPIDYSKWDKLELSDDSDVEVHPNVDKKSFIRMKQRQIHDERIKRDQDIKVLNVQSEMYEHLNKRVDQLLLGLKDNELLDEKARNKFLADHFDGKEKSTQQDLEDAPTYNEMIEDLFSDIYSRNKIESAGQLRQLIVEHRKKIDEVSKQNGKKLEELRVEKMNSITSEDLHTGFDSFYTNREQINQKSAEEPNAKPEPVKQVKDIETINSPKVEEIKEQKSAKQELDEMKLYPETEEFGKISAKDYLASAKFLRSNPFIVNGSQKDGLLMKAFDYQLKDESKEAENIVHQSLIIQYISDLVGKNASVPQVEKGIGIFFEKIIQDNRLLLKETDNTFTHVKQRCEILKKENTNLSTTEDEEQEEQIQLKSLDPNSKLTVILPDPAKDAEKFKEFLTLPETMQQAVKTGSLDEINKVFATMKIEAAEKVLETFEKSGVIGIQAVLENEKEWENMKGNYQDNSIELRSTDPNAELVVLSPDETNQETYQEFLKLPQEMQNAVRNESLDEVNQVFAKLGQDHAQEVIELLEKAGVLALYQKKQNLADEID